MHGRTLRPRCMRANPHPKLASVARQPFVASLFGHPSQIWQRLFVTERIQLSTRGLAAKLPGFQPSRGTRLPRRIAHSTLPMPISTYACAPVIACCDLAHALGSASRTDRAAAVATRWVARCRHTRCVFDFHYPGMHACLAGDQHRHRSSRLQLFRARRVCGLRIATPP